jgi:hypothetical protein
MLEQVNALLVANNSIYRINSEYCLVDIAGNVISDAIPELALEDYVNELIEDERSCK